MTREVQPGDVIAGKYLIERLLGRGGMGMVFLARQERLDRRVAIKFLLPEVMSSALAVSRFEREARAAAALLSDHVTRVFDVGHLESGEPYMVMELLLGEDLAAMLGRRGPLPPAEVIDIIVQACDAIAEAHAIGVVHRDIKPANIFLVRRPNGIPTVKVLDFGISKATGTTGASLTGSASLMGSPLYMSPEQVREARTVDGRADIWALGVTAYELLVGAPPFASAAVGEICAQILTVDPDSTRRHRPEVPRALDAAIMRCLRKDPAERFGTAGELAAALKSAQVAPAALATLFFDGAPGSATGAPPESAAGDGPPGKLTTEAVSRTHPPTYAPRRQKRVLAVSVAAGALAMAGASIATWAVLTGRAPPEVHNDVAVGARGIGVAASAAASASAPAPAPAPAPASASASAPAPAPASASAYRRQGRPEIGSEAIEGSEPAATSAHPTPHNPLDLPHLQ